METPAKRPATDFGAPGVVSHFRGPFADGPPARALHVSTPSIDKFGYAELKRMVVIYLTISLCLLRASVSAAHTPEQIDEIVSRFGKVMSALGAGGAAEELAQTA